MYDENSHIESENIPQKIVNKNLDIIRIEKVTISLEYSNNENRITKQNIGQHEPFIKINIVTIFLHLKNEVQNGSQ